MKKQIAGLRWEPHSVTHLGCVKGCLDYLRAGISWEWLSGDTGHAFIINMHKVVCPSGPTAWHTEMLFRLATKRWVSNATRPVILYREDFTW